MTGHPRGMGSYAQVGQMEMVGAGPLGSNGTCSHRKAFWNSQWIQNIRTNMNSCPTAKVTKGLETVRQVWKRSDEKPIKTKLF